MPQVSKNFMSKKVEDRAFQIFLSSVASASNKESFFVDLFTRTEKIMLAKRLTIGYMLSKEIDYRTICEVMKVSSGTVWSVAERLKMPNSELKKTLEKMLLKEDLKEMLNGFLSIFAPPNYHLREDYRAHALAHKSGE